MLVMVVVALVATSGAALGLGGREPETFCNADPCVGTDGDDALGGINEAETIDVLAGNDFVIAYGGKDEIHGSDGKDELDGHYGNDTIYGGPGADLLYGSEHSDTVYGGVGPDRINAAGYDSEPIGARPFDHSYGQSGNDTIRSFDGFRDAVDCGPGGKDTVIYDRTLDTVKHCEIKKPIN